MSNHTVRLTADERRLIVRALAYFAADRPESQAISFEAQRLAGRLAYATTRRGRPPKALDRHASTRREEEKK